MSEKADTERSTVMTYVPAHQKSEWTAHADELGMSQAEYVRTMVQAGRKGFELDSEGPDLEGSSDPSNPGVTASKHVSSTRSIRAIRCPGRSWLSHFQVISRTDSKTHSNHSRRKTGFGTAAARVATRWSTNEREPVD